MNDGSEKVRILAVCISALILLGCETLREADETLYEVSEATAPRDRITGERTLNFDDRADQIRKGDALVEEAVQAYRSEGKPVNEQVDQNAYERIKRITNDILRVSHFADEKWTVVLLPDSEFNAFVTGGTYVVVYKGLVDEVQSDDEIAAVIGHEIAHVAAGHLSERSAHTTVFGLVRKKSTSRDGYEQAFTNLNEQEADKIGVVYAALAGYDPYAASRLWLRKSQEGREVWNYFRTHPASSARAAATREYADTAQQYFTPGKANPDHLNLVICNAIWCNQDKQLAAGEGGGLVSFLESGLKAYSDHLKTETERLRQQNEIMAEATRKAYGLPAPATSPKTALAASNDYILVERVYQGRITYFGKGKSARVVTQFKRDSSGHLVGRYIEKADGRELHGIMRLIRKVSDNQYEFEWTNDGLSGTAQLRFTRYGTFRGKWEFEHRGEVWTGSWNGKVS